MGSLPKRNMEKFTAKLRNIQETKFPIVKAVFKGNLERFVTTNSESRCKKWYALHIQAVRYPYRSTVRNLSKHREKVTELALKMWSRSIFFSKSGDYAPHLINQVAHRQVRHLPLGKSTDCPWGSNTDLCCDRSKR